MRFLNRGPVPRMEDPDDPRLRAAFDTLPSGTTPLTRRVEEVVQTHWRRPGARPLLLVIATDGEPDGGADTFKRSLRRIIADKARPVRFQIMACTDDEHAIGWLNEFDLEFDEVDVCDDFASERREVLASGRMRSFTRADWVMKALLGPVSTKFDRWDESSPRRRQARGRGLGGQQQGGGGSDIMGRALLFFLAIAVLWKILFSRV